MNSPSNSPLGGRADADDWVDLLPPATFPHYAGQDGKAWVVIAGGRQERHRSGLGAGPSTHGSSGRRAA